jgi:DNA replication protein DnaC
VKQPWSEDFVDLRTKFLPDEEAALLYEHFPEVPGSVEEGCPTCDGEGHFRWRGEEHQCDCLEQLQLHKHYLAARIGVTFQRLDWPDYVGDPDALTVVSSYLQCYRDMVRSGVGLTFQGQFGTGKTMLSNLVAKALVRLGYRVFYTTFNGMIQMFTSGWTSTQDRVRFETKVVRSQILVLDDVSRTHRTKSNLPESTFDHVLRQRVVNARPTIITSNDTETQLGQAYGGAILSLLRENSIPFVFSGDDWRAHAVDRTLAEIKTKERRPIT